MAPGDALAQLMRNIVSQSLAMLMGLVMGLVLRLVLVSAGFAPNSRLPDRLLLEFHRHVCF